MIKNANDKDFNDIVLGSKIAVVDFWAPWCGPCQAFGPILEEFSNEVSDVVVAKVNVDECPDLARAYKISSIPSIILFVDGVATKLLVGLQSKDALKKLIGK